MARALTGQRLTDAEMQSMGVDVGKYAAPSKPQKGVSGQRLTDAEMQAMGVDVGKYSSDKPAPPEQTPQPSGVEGVKDFGGAVGLLADQAGGGAMASLKRTYLGLKQLATYMTGDDAAKQAVNDEIQRMEEEYGPVLATPAGKVGNIAGTVGQFMVPGMAASRAAKVMPGAANLIRGIAGDPGSMKRAAVTSGLFAGSQPVVQGNADPEAYLASKAGDVAIGAATGAAGQAIANKLFNPGIPTPDNRLAQVSAAQRQGFQVRPAQRTGDFGMWQKEKAFASNPATANRMADLQAADNEVVTRKALSALGVNSDKLDAEAIKFAKVKASQLYADMRAAGQFPKVKWDLDSVIDEFPEIETQANRLKELMPKMNGQRFASELQRLRNSISDTYKAGGESTNTREGLKLVAEKLEDYGERALTLMASRGQVPAKALDNMKAGREAYAVIHRIEPSVNHATGNLDISKFLRREESKHPVVRSAIDKQIQPIREAAESYRFLQPPKKVAADSGTPSGIAGLIRNSMPGRLFNSMPFVQNYIQSSQGNALNNYLSSGQPNALTALVGPNVSGAVRRMIPPSLLAIQEDINR